MSDISVIRRGVGGMDYDSAPEYIAPDDYRSAFNIQGQSAGNNGDSRNEIVKGTSSIRDFEIPDVVSSSKQYKVSNIDGTSSYVIKFMYGNRSTIVSTSTFSTPAQLITQIGVALPAPQYSITSSSTSDSVTFSVQVRESTTLYDGFDFYIQSTGDEGLTIECLREAIPSGMAGKQYPIGSFDLLGDLFIWATTNISLPDVKSYTISSISTGAGVNASVTTSSAHDLSTGDVILISGVVGSPEISGIHFIVSTGANTFVIPGVSLTTYTSGGTITSNPISHGSISVHKKQRDTATWTSHVLLSSRELNLRRKKQIDVDMEKDANKVSAYFTDDYNQMRVFYYKGAYLTNGAISTVSSDGQYSYDSISEELRLASSVNSVSVSFNSQLSSGGSLLDGNYRYTCRFITESNSPSAWIPLSNPINVAVGDYASPKTVKGGVDGSENTGKVNIINISGSFESIFKEIEVAYVHYFGTSFVSGIFYRGPVPESEGDVRVLHTGNESVENIDIGSLNDASPFYETAKNIRIIDNRLVISNLTSQSVYDFALFTESITYSLQKYTIDSFIDSAFNFSNKEYLSPSNVHSKMGYMLNETYRFAFVYELYNGYRTQPYWTGYDVTFDTNTVTASATGREASGGLSDYNLQPISGLISFVDVPYIKFTLPNLDQFVADGVRFRDVVKRVHVLRAEVTNPTVLVSGVIALGVSGVARIGGGPTDISCSYLEDVSISPSLVVGETPIFHMGTSTSFTGNFGINTDTTYPPEGSTGVFTAEPGYCAMYSGDILLDNVSISRVSGDIIRVFGQGTSVESAVSFVDSNGTIVAPSGVTEWVNRTVRWLSDHGAADYGDHNCDELFSIPQGDATTIMAGSVVFSKIESNNNSPGAGAALYEMQKSFALKSATTITDNASAASDYGVYYAQYIRPLINQYGDVQNNRFVYTGSYIDINASSASTGNTVDTFGGDTFTQTTYIKSRIPSSRANGANPTWSGGGVCTMWIGQNRSNFHMRGDGENPPERPNESLQGHFPSEITKEVWLTRKSDLSDVYTYNQGYGIRNIINEYRAFDEDLITSSDLPATIAYSDIKAQGGNVDNYRLFLPLNRKDLNLSDGEINHHDVVNGELVTIQNRSFKRQFFNTTGILTTVEGSEVIMGDGAALTRRGVTMSSYGTRNKWSVVKGRSQGGSDVLYWFDSEMGVVMRLGYDGAVPISIRHNMDSFFRSQSRFSFDRDTPADDQGVHGVWDESFRRYILTSRCRIENIQEYDPGSSYNTSDVVSYAGLYQTYEQTGEYFMATETVDLGETPITNPEKWTALPHTITDYYNEYTIVWSESENKFKSFLTPVPKIYFRYSNGYLISDPLNENEIYEANNLNYSQWFGAQSADATIDYCFNEQPEIQKTAIAISIDSDSTPHRADFETRNHESFLVSSEFELLENQYRSPVKNDSSVTGINSGDTSRVFGRYVFGKITMLAGNYNWVRSVIMKMRPRHRLPNR